MIKDVLNSRMKFWLLSLLLSVFCTSSLAEGVTITHVVLNKTVLTSQDKEPFTIDFQLSEDATVEFIVYDGRHYQVYLQTMGNLAAGKHTVEWDGNVEGKRLPQEAYVYTLVAKQAGQAPVIYDLTDVTGGETVDVDVTYNDKEEQVEFFLEKPARLMIRAGLKNAFLLKTLAQGEVFSAGSHTIAWDGFDESRQMNIKGKANYLLQIEGYYLSRNSMIVENNETQSLQRWLELGENVPKREVKASRRTNLSRYLHMSPEQIRDTTVFLTLVDPNNGRVLPQKDFQLTQGNLIDLRLSLPHEDQIRFESARSEVVFYINGDLATEGEISYFPYTWRFDSKGLPPGDYYVTGFVVNFNRQFGAMTQKITVVEP